MPFAPFLSSNQYKFCDIDKNNGPFSTDGPLSVQIDKAGNLIRNNKFLFVGSDEERSPLSMKNLANQNIIKYIGEIHNGTCYVQCYKFLDEFLNYYDLVDLIHSNFRLEKRYCGKSIYTKVGEDPSNIDTLKIFELSFIKDQETKKEEEEKEAPSAGTHASRLDRSGDRGELGK